MNPPAVATAEHRISPAGADWGHVAGVGTLGREDGKRGVDGGRRRRLGRANMTGISAGDREGGAGECLVGGSGPIVILSALLPEMGLLIIIILCLIIGRSSRILFKLKIIYFILNKIKFCIMI